MDKTLREIAIEDGLGAALAEWRLRRQPLSAERARLQGELGAIQDRLMALDEEFARVSGEAETVPGAAGLETRERGDLTNRDLVLDILQARGGRLKSRSLYRETEQRGRLRQTVYVTVSKLIKAGTLRKLPLEGERGSILELADTQSEAGCQEPGKGDGDVRADAD